MKVSRRAFTIEYKAEVVRHKKPENLSFVETGKQCGVLPTLELIAEFSISVAAPIETGDVQGASARGKRRTIRITGGTVRGRLNGRVLARGADFQLIMSDTMAVLDARYTLEQGALRNTQTLLNGRLPIASGGTASVPPYAGFHFICPSCR